MMGYSIALSTCLVKNLISADNARKSKDQSFRDTWLGKPGKWGATLAETLSQVTPSSITAWAHANYLIISHEFGWPLAVCTGGERGMLFDNVATITQEMVRLDVMVAISTIRDGHKVKQAPAAQRRKSFAAKPLKSLPSETMDASFSTRPPPPSANNKVAPSSS